MGSNIKVETGYGFEDTIRKLEEAVRESDLRIVSRINAQENLAGIGIEIGGNQIFELFSPDIAREVLEGDPDAGIVPPVRVYLYEKGTGTVIIYQDSEKMFSEYSLHETGKKVNGMIQSIVQRAIS